MNNVILSLRIDIHLKNIFLVYMGLNPGTVIKTLQGSDL